MLRSTLLLTTLLCGLVSSVHSANILGIFPMPSISHQNTFQPVVKELAQRGHNLTVITPNPINDPNLKTLTEIDLQEISYRIWDKYNISSFGVKEDVVSTDVIEPMVMALKEILVAQLSHPKVHDMISNSIKYHFDMLILEYPMNFGINFKRIYNTSLVGITSMPLYSLGHMYIGNPSHPVLFPDLNLPYSNTLTFWQKINSFVFSTLGTKVHQMYVQQLNEIAANYFGSDLVNHQQKAISTEFDLVLVNNNPVLFVPKPNVPVVVEFNGIHIKPGKDLPRNIKGFLDSATEGAVCISFGSNIKSDEIPLAKRQMFIEALSELPYKFIWKFESNITELPKNVLIMKWIPQQDVLRHQNIKLFVTQGGLQSLDEAMYTKTPVLVIPFFGDQFGNAQKAQQAGLGRTLNFKSLTKEAFKAAVAEIINDQTYKSRLEEVHDILIDQPMSAVDKTVWWIEYVLRHKGAKHLRCATVDATVIEYYLIDVIGFFVLCFLLVLFFIYTIAKFMIKLGKKFLNLLYHRCGDKNKGRKVKNN